VEIGTEVGGLSPGRAAIVGLGSAEPGQPNSAESGKMLITFPATRPYDGKFGGHCDFGWKLQRPVTAPSHRFMLVEVEDSAGRHLAFSA
jgi:hypothetical protein